MSESKFFEPRDGESIHDFVFRTVRPVMRDCIAKAGPEWPVRFLEHAMGMERAEQIEDFWKLLQLPNKHAMLNLAVIGLDAILMDIRDDQIRLRN